MTPPDPTSSMPGPTPLESGGGDSAEQDHLLDPAVGSSDEIASDLFIHGLIEWIHRTDGRSRERRIQSVLSVLRREHQTREPNRFAFPRWILSIAAVLLIATVLVFFVGPGAPTALAEVQRSIKLMSAPGDRRYQARVLSWRDAADAEHVPGATIDMRSDLLVVRHRPPGYADPIVVGRDGKGFWAVRQDGAIERGRPLAYWPPWSMDGESLFIAALDRIPQQLEQSYALTRTASVRLEGSPGLSLDLITATRHRSDGPMPNVVDVWIDRRTGQVERIEAKWSSPDGDGAKPAPRHGASRSGRKIPPRMILLQREVAPTLPENWFEATTHGKN